SSRMQAFSPRLLPFFVIAQIAAAAPSDDAAQKAAAAAERAAVAAERSAAAAERAAAVLEAAHGVTPPTAAPGAPPAAAAVTKAPNPWTLTAGVGMISITGNAQTLTLTANVAAQRKAEKWILNLRANGAYGTSTPTASGGSAEILALSALFAGQVDYRFSQ